MRVAFVTPLPPAPTGIADYAADLLALLAPRHQIDLFHEQQQVDGGRLPRSCVLRAASELPSRHAERPYDVVVHQMGNAAAHAFVYDLLSRVPGLLVLHELVLFHARAAMLADAEPVRAWRRRPDSRAAAEAARPWLEAWREELTYTYPAQGERLFDAHLGTVGDLLPYAYPLFRIPVEASRAVLVHSRHAARIVREEVPGTTVYEAPLVLHPHDAASVSTESVAALRARLGFGPQDVVVGAFGLMTREKRLDSLAAAFARASRQDPRLRLLLAGPVADGGALEALLLAHEVRGAAVTGRVPIDELPTHIAAADLVVHLRWPTAGESSAALLRVMAQGRAAIVSDLQQQSAVPDAAVRRVDPAREQETLERELLALAADQAAREAVGKAAAAHVREAHSAARVLAAWEAALEGTRSAPGPGTRAWPAHWPRAAR